MTVTAARHRRKLAGLVMLPVAALALGACAPKPAPPPPPPPTVSCTVGGTLSEAVEACHTNYRAYNLDTANNGAEATVARILAAITPTSCSSALASFHSSGATLMGYYPAASSGSENLYCMYFSNGQCPSAALGATKAMNGWLASPGHKANMDSILSLWVNAAAGCVPTASGGSGVYIAVAQFHT
ncbi:MAG: hypothetical protein EXQ79_01380 [Acidimicrobiia bacterium]|nr:hypothetical protein [Acidimicrobiia bacterium]